MRVRVLSAYLITYFISATASAVCLLDDYSVKAEFGRSVAVVRATVVSERTLPDGPNPDSIGGTLYTVKIQESFRGTLRGRIEVFNENSSGRFPMVKGKSYLLFLYQESGRLSADNCGNSGLASEKKQVLATLRAIPK